MPPAASGAMACAPTRCRSHSSGCAPSRSCRRSRANRDQRTGSAADRSPVGASRLPRGRCRARSRARCSAQRARSYDGIEHPAKPTAERRSWPRWSIMRYWDDLVSSDEDGLRDRQAQRLRGLEVDDQLELRRLLHWKSGGSLAFEDPVGVRGSSTPEIEQTRPIGSESTRLRTLPPHEHGWESSFRGEVDHLHSLEKECRPLENDDADGVPLHVES